MTTTVLFHRTTQEAAEAILADGFRNGMRMRYMTSGVTHRGVWFSNVPLDSNEGIKGDTLLRVEFACHEARLWRWEWIEEDKPYREWLVPVHVLKRYLARIEIDAEEIAA